MFSSAMCLFFLFFFFSSGYLCVKHHPACPEKDLNLNLLVFAFALIFNSVHTQMADLRLNAFPSVIRGDSTGSISLDPSISSIRAPLIRIGMSWNFGNDHMPPPSWLNSTVGPRWRAWEGQALQMNVTQCAIFWPQITAEIPTMRPQIHLKRFFFLFSLLQSV